MRAVIMNNNIDYRLDHQFRHCLDVLDKHLHIIWSKRKPAGRPISLWFVLACYITHYAMNACMGKLKP